MKEILLIFLVMQIIVILLRRSTIVRMLKLTFKIAKDILKLDYQLFKSAYKYINKKVDKKLKDKKQKQTSLPKAVGDDSNVIPFPRKPIA